MCRHYSRQRTALVCKTPTSTLLSREVITCYNNCCCCAAQLTWTRHVKFRRLAHFAHDCFICSQWVHFSKYRDATTVAPPHVAPFKVTPRLYCAGHFASTQMQHLSYTVHASLLSHCSRWSSRHQKITDRHSITLILLCSGLLHMRPSMLRDVKNFWHQSGPRVPKLIWWWSQKWHRDQSGTEIDIYRNGLPRGPERHRYRTSPNHRKQLANRLHGKLQGSYYSPHRISSGPNGPHRTSTDPNGPHRAVITSSDFLPALPHPIDVKKTKNYVF